MSAAAGRGERMLRCPRCGAELAPGQEWCLECGFAAATRIAGPPRWRVPVAVVTAVVALAGAGLALALAELSDDAGREVAAATATAPPATAPPATAPPATAPPATAPTATTPPAETAPSGEPVPSGPASWPSGKEAWTVVLMSATDRGAAERRARDLAASVQGVGLLRSDDYASLRPGYWVVFSGQFASAEQAQAEAGRLAGSAPGAYARLVKPR